MIVGGGPAGFLTALTAVELGAKVALVERDLLGGVCFNVGCIPSKSMIRRARLYAEMRNAENFGAQVPVRHPRRLCIRDGTDAAHSRARQPPGFGASVCARLVSTCFSGKRDSPAPTRLRSTARRLRFKKALIATGARPRLPTIPGLAEAGYLTNESIFDTTECPRRLLVIGGGPLGCELAQAFCRLGSQVSIVQDDPMFLGNEERDAAQILSDAMARDGIGIHLNTDTVRVRKEGNEKIADLVSDDYKFTIAADEILVGIGSTPNVSGMNLEAVGVDYNKEDGIPTNDYLQTSNPRIYAAGDVCSEHKFPHIENGRRGHRRQQRAASRAATS